MASDHFRQIGSFSIAGESGTSVSNSTSTLSSVPLNMSVTRDIDRNLLLQEEVHTLLQKGSVELVNPPLTPGFYSCSFLVPKKNGKIRNVIDLFVLNQHLIVPQFNSLRYVDNVSRFDRRLFPHSYFHQVPQVPEICLGRQGIRFQDDAFWPIYSPSSI